jgi:hypothetical protein
MWNQMKERRGEERKGEERKGEERKEVLLYNDYDICYYELEIMVKILVY